MNSCTVFFLPLISIKGHLLLVPQAPKDFDILAIPLTTAAVKMLKTTKGMPEEWPQYLGKPAPWSLRRSCRTHLEDPCNT